MNKKTYKRILTIAGSDSGGGAGIQADLKTFTALNCYGMSAITALTAQNTMQVKQVHPIPAEFVAQQIAAVIEDIGVDAIKIGMLCNTTIIQMVANELKKIPHVPIVLDPVIVATSGDLLLEQTAITALKNDLLPMTTIITPNLHEAELLWQNKITSTDVMQTAAKELSKLGCQAVLIKGGHLTQQDCVDCLYTKKDNKIQWIKAARIITNNTHGTGCTLSAAIAAYLAQNFDLLTAVNKAKTYITNAIKLGAEYQIGSGHGPVKH